MRLAVARTLVTGACLFLAGSTPALSMAQGADIDKGKTLLAARARYYNLRTAGLSEVRAAIQPNWDVLLEGIKEPAGSKTLLNNLHFWFSIDAAGNFRLSHDGKAIPEDQVKGVENIFQGVNLAVTGFFRTWSIFVISSPFPEPGSDYALERLANGFRFSQRQGELDVTTETDNEFAITEIRVVAGDRTTSLKPVLEKTPAGLVLTGYKASARRADGTVTTVQVSLEYGTVSGLRLLNKVNLDTVFQGGETKFEWAFSDYQVKMR